MNEEEEYSVRISDRESVGHIKTWLFKEAHVCRRFFKGMTNELKSGELFYREAGDSEVWFINGDIKHSFKLKRVGRVIHLAWVNPDRKVLWRDKIYVSFESIFEKASVETRKALVFHIDIFQ